MINRRKLMLLLGGAISAPRALCAQQRAVPEVGFLGISSAALYEARLDALRQGLNEIGRVEGQNLTIEYRWAEDRYDRLPALAAELVGRKVDAIVATASPAALAAKSATPRIPIVFVAVADPVTAGLAASLARPGGNITGFVTFDASINTKYLQLLKDIAPRMTRVAVLQTEATRSALGRNDFAAVEQASQPLAIKAGALIVLDDAADIERAIAGFAQEPDGGLILPPDNALTKYRTLIIALAAKHRLPAIYANREYVDAGGLMYYNAAPLDYHRVAAYVDRILRGEKPGDLPVQFPTKFEMIVNRKTATALGLAIPPSILLRADEVVE